MKQQHLRVFFWLLLATVSFLALSPKPPATADLGWDKLNHIAAFLALGGLARLAWPAPPWWRWALLLLLYGGVLSEPVLAPVLGAASLGVLLAALLMIWLVRQSGRAEAAA